MNRNVLRWYGHAERTEEEIMDKKVYRAKVEDSRGRERPKLRWMDT
jgi:hypothetical protein